MKIYKSVTIDIDSGEILHEDSYEYDGPIAHLGGDGDGNGGNGDAGAAAAGIAGMNGGGGTGGAGGFGGMDSAAEGQIGGPGSMGGDPGAPGVGPGIGTGMGLGGGVGASNIGGAASEGQIGVPAGQMASDLGISIGQAAAGMLGAGLNPATGYGMPGFAEAFGDAVARGFSHSDAASIAQAASAMDPSDPATMGLVGAMFGPEAELGLMASMIDAAPGMAVGMGMGMLGSAFGVPGMGLLGSLTGINPAIADALGLTPEAPDLSMEGVVGTMGGLGLVGEAEGGGGWEEPAWRGRGRYTPQGQFPTWLLNRFRNRWSRGPRLPRAFRQPRETEGGITTPVGPRTYKPYIIDAPYSEIFGGDRTTGDILSAYNAPSDLYARQQIEKAREMYESPQLFGLPTDYPQTAYGLQLIPPAQPAAATYGRGGGFGGPGRPRYWGGWGSK